LAHISTATAGRPGAPSVAAPPEQAQQYLTFMLGNESFAIGILAIKEIIEYSQLTQVPMMPAYVRGVINLRGAVVPVADVSVRFGRPSSEVTKRTCIVIVEVTLGGERQDLGLVVDSVSAVLEIPQADIEPPPTFGTRIRSEFIQGMGKVNGRFVILLNVHALVTIEEAAQLAHVAATSEANV
jgi:purine-binding chemotaxis protein CheW